MHNDDRSSQFESRLELNLQESLKAKVLDRGITKDGSARWRMWDCLGRCRVWAKIVKAAKSPP